MSLHIVSLPHTVVSSDYSTCAFTGKVLRFSTMIHSISKDLQRKQLTPWVVHEYSNGQSNSDADFHHVVLSHDQLMTLTRRTHKHHTYDQDIGNELLNKVFKQRLLQLLRTHVRNGDIVLHVFGPDGDVMNAVPHAKHVESGIGYEAGCKPVHSVCPYRIFESVTWREYHTGGKQQTRGTNYQWVCPNYYDAHAWPLVEKPKCPDTVLYFGRVISTKGTATVVEVARRMPHLRFLLVGQCNDPSEWHASTLPSNIAWHEPINGPQRASLLGNVRCLLAPTSFIEPFCGSASEALLCGTPVVSTDFGVFGVKIRNGVNGWRCNTLADFVEAIERVPTLDRAQIRQIEKRQCDYPVVAKLYDSAFRQIMDLAKAGWYSEKSRAFALASPHDNDDDDDRASKRISWSDLPGTLDSAKLVRPDAPWKPPPTETCLPSPLRSEAT